VKPSTFKKIAIIVGTIVATGLLVGIVAASPTIKKWLKSSPQKANDQATQDAQNQPPAVVELPKEEAKQQIKKKPPKKSTGGNISGSVKENSDGSQTTVVSDGGAAASELSKIAGNGPGSGAPYGIRFVDETGQNAGLEQQIKDFMNAHLKWGSEVPYLYQVTIRDAGASGWEGQYGGSYTMTGGGDIIAAFGTIILNTYYHKNDPYFVDYMKLVFAHEYGHHYTLYHKWLDWDIPSGQRFPDAYYSVRPLSKSNTAPDYSQGWSNCDAEIIAEDYSYIYSGYGYHAMAGARGYPSAGTRLWLESLPSGSSVSPPSSPPAVDAAPQVSITSPANGATLSGAVTLSANATDDKGISKVMFYVNSANVATDTSSPYSASVNTAGYGDGNYTLKAVAYDTAGQTTEATVAVTFSNAAPPPAGDTAAPTVSVIEPTNPYAWDAGVPTLYIKFRSTDNVAVTKLKIYVNGAFWQEFAGSGIDISWTYGPSIPAGAYIFKGEAYDAAGNMGEVSVTINKT
jgi:hypothetical protein